MKMNNSNESMARKAIKVPSNIRMRTESEVRAYSYLPHSIQKVILRNEKVRFRPYHVYYPDLLLLGPKIAIEIDGSSHLSEKRRKKDAKKDKEFMENGYAMIRIKNEETIRKGTFLRKLHHELLLIPDINNRRGGKAFIKSVEALLWS